MATEIVTRQDVDPGNFMAGVALMDDMLDAGKQHGGADFTEAAINAEEREGEALNLFLRPYLRTLMSQPALLDGFAAALGEIVLCLQMGIVLDPESAFRDLSFGHVFGDAGGQSPDSATDTEATVKTMTVSREETEQLLHHMSELTGLLSLAGDGHLFNLGEDQTVAILSRALNLADECNMTMGRVLPSWETSHA
jgi:hypothetical protein